MDGAGEWRFQGTMNGFQAEMVIVFYQRQAGFVQRRLGIVASFLKLLEPLIADLEISHPDRRPDSGIEHSLDPPLVGRSSFISGLGQQLNALSDSEISLLIEGESGTGKEIVARNVHHLSMRRLRPLVIVNCMEMPQSLLQSELFGHLKGSFTGASGDRIGLIESAAGGTFFLDEIGEMPLSLQAALLRVLEEKEVRRIGDHRRRKVDVRFVFATNRDLLDLVKEGAFREDLYFRVNGVRLYIPPLRERRQDILPLAEHFLKLCALRSGVRPPTISVEALRRMFSYHWPGNVRELRNEMERVVVLNKGIRTIKPGMLSPQIREAVPVSGKILYDDGETLPSAVQRLERRLIGEALGRFNGNRTKTAGALGITRQGLLKKLKRYGMIKKQGCG
ncbi:MAG: sigma-54-dependent Fis family transcriptional regulator, partial [Candidatus Krumholzibacteria bacterium]|nr:sigma-54-dependent Fis family transcriptional regulator [Candidatus Krumholzibacteria bacterium]